MYLICLAIRKYLEFKKKKNLNKNKTKGKKQATAVLQRTDCQLSLGY